MRYLEESDCKKYCEYHPVCAKFGKLYREGCVLDTDGFQMGHSKDAQERDRRITRLIEKLADSEEERRERRMRA